MRELEHETFGDTWPYTPRFHDVGGVRLHYVDEGAGEPLLLVHGNPTWGYVWRHVIAALAGDGVRCVAPDHMGFGKSDTPLDGPYHLAGHIAHLEALVEHLDLRDITLAVQDWGGPIGLGMAVRRPERIKRLVVLNTWAFRYPADFALPGLLELFRQPHVGEGLVQGLNLFVEGYLPAGIHHKERLPELMPVYRAPFPDFNHRIGTLRFPRDIPVGPDHPTDALMGDIEDALPAIDVPVLIAWGMRDPDFDPSVLDQWRAVYPHAEVRALDDASHFVQEDAPDRVPGLIGDFLART